VNIVSPETQAATLNQALRRAETAEQQTKKLTTEVETLRQRVTELEDTREVSSSNNIVFTWAGGTATLSWADGYVQDKAEKVYPVTAGSRVLTASTVYWVAWNFAHKVMAFSEDVTPLQTNKYNLVLCSLKTGSAVQNGDAGGGGTEAGGSGITGGRFSNFP
jgi:hypothetical protein